MFDKLFEDINKNVNESSTEVLHNKDHTIEMTICHSGGRTYGDIVLKHPGGDRKQVIPFEGNDANYRHYIGLVESKVNELMTPLDAEDKRDRENPEKAKRIEKLRAKQAKQEEFEKQNALMKAANEGPGDQWTAFISWSGGKQCEEEIDVKAKNETEARKKAQEVLDCGFYEPGGKIIHLEKRIGLYW